MATAYKLPSGHVDPEGTDTKADRVVSGGAS